MKMLLKRFLPLFLVMCGSLAPLSLSAQEETDKIGTVDMQKLLAEYHKTKDLVARFKGYEQTILDQNEEKTEAIKKLATESQELQAQAENASLPQDKQKEMLGKVMGQRREVQAMEEARLTWLDRKRRAFQEAQSVDFGGLRKELVEMVKAVGEELEYDFIFDSAGASITNVQVLAYSKDATDLTALVIERANRDAPEDTEEGEGSGEEEESE